MTDLAKLHQQLHDAAPEAIADALRYLGKAEAVRHYLAPVAPAAAVPDGWRVMWFSSSIRPDGERWEIYDPEGSGGAVSTHDVRDGTAKRLLDALAERKEGS